MVAWEHNALQSKPYYISLFRSKMFLKSILVLTAVIAIAAGKAQFGLLDSLVIIATKTNKLKLFNNKLEG
jgi:hypothetical protein